MPSDNEFMAQRMWSAQQRDIERLSGDVKTLQAQINGLHAMLKELTGETTEPAAAGCGSGCSCGLSAPAARSQFQPPAQPPAFISTSGISSDTRRSII